jgi:hypothetical protein
MCLFRRAVWCGALFYEQRVSVSHISETPVDFKTSPEPGMVTRPCNPSTWEAEAGGF